MSEQQNRDYFEELMDRYSSQEPLIARITSADGKKEKKFVRTENGYVLRQSTSINEASIICAGQISYDGAQAEMADFDDTFMFRGGFRPARPCIEAADLSIASFSAMAADVYPPSEVMENEYSKNPHFRNARQDYLDAVRYGGFDCLAMAGPYSACAGVRGVLSTESCLKKYDLLSSGIGREKSLLVEINNISVAVLSYTVCCYEADRFFTDEGKETLLNIYSEQRVRENTAEARAAGADFIIAFINFEREEKALSRKERKRIAAEAAEAGADYVVCNVPGELSEYLKYTTEDERVVPVAAGLGTFMSGAVKTGEELTALLSIRLYKKEDGSIDISDAYIPLKRFEEYEGCPFAAVPVSAPFCLGNKSLKPVGKDNKIGRILGNGISLYEKGELTLKRNAVPQLTCREIYEILGVRPKASDRLRLNMNKKVFIAGRKNDLKKNCVAIRLNFKGFYTEAKTQMELKDALKAGASLWIDTKPCSRIPCIVVDDCKEAYMKLMKAVREKYDPVTVAITGTAGKTTTKELMSAVFDTHYKTLHVAGNNNQYVSAGIIMQKLTPEYEAYIQEVHGGSRNSAKNISNMIKPDIALITNIGEGHLKDMGTIENVIKGKMEIISGLQKDGVLIIDDDNEYLHQQHPGCKVIRYSLHNENCDYYARNIEDLGDRLKFQIVCQEGVFDAQLNFQGIHNISNALGVFAAGRYAGIPPYKIIAGLTHYVPDADKQNLIEAGGYKLLIDSYSSTAVSVESAVKGLSAYPLEEGQKKIAVIGDIPALGNRSAEVHREVAKRLVRYDFDLMICCGDDSVYFVEEAEKAGKEAYHFTDRDEFNRKIIDSIRPGDLILFKGGTRLHFKEETIYPLFGKIV
ncbi:MAG: Mur ligase family protein [Emergencia sp.]